MAIGSKNLKSIINSCLKKNKSSFKITEDAFYVQESTSLFYVESGHSTGVLKAVRVNKTDKFDAVESSDMYDPYRLFQREISSFKLLMKKDCKYTVRILEGPYEADFRKDKEIYFFIMEQNIPIVTKKLKADEPAPFCPTIKKWIKKYGLDKVMAYMGYCIAHSLKELHSVGITAQRDIKPENIYIDREDEDMFKCRFILGDFGTAHIDGANATNPSDHLGTMYYIPGNNEDNTKWHYDQFMLGINLYVQFNGKLIPLSVDRKDDERYSEWALGNEDIPKPLKTMPDERLWKIIKKMTHYDVSRRYSDEDELISDIKAFLTGTPESGADSDDTLDSLKFYLDMGNKYYYGIDIPQDYEKAIYFYKNAAYRGNAEAQNNLGDCYYYGHGVPQDYNKAVEWYRKSADQGNAAAQNNLGFCYQYGYGVTQDYNNAVDWYRKAAEQGLAVAQYNLGYCYAHGHGVTQDYNNAVDWYQKAAEQGYAKAQNNLGFCYKYGHGVPQDYNKAVDWYQKAAEQGLAEAQNNLGFCYEHGHGVPQDYNKAVDWYQKAAEQGLAAAQNNLGYCYAHGHGVPQDYNNAVDWYQKAAEQGDAKAQNNLGDCYYYGHGVTQDYNNAVDWYRKAAEQGLAVAQYNLGYCYAHGHGVPQDYNEAVEWYRKSADQGYAAAQNNLGDCYQYGYGVTQDYNKAVEWYQKAAEQGHQAAKRNLELAIKKLEEES